MKLDPREQIAKEVEGRVVSSGTEENNKILWQASSIPSDEQLANWTTSECLAMLNILKNKLAPLSCYGAYRRIIKAQIGIMQAELDNRNFNHTKVIDFNMTNSSAKHFVRTVKEATKYKHLVEIYPLQLHLVESTANKLNKNDQIYLQKVLSSPGDYNVRKHGFSQ